MRRMIPLAWWINSCSCVLHVKPHEKKQLLGILFGGWSRHGACCSQACRGYPMRLALVPVALQHFQVPSPSLCTVDPWFNEPLYNEVLGIMNDFLQPGQNYNKMYWTEPQYNEPQFNKILVITNTIQKCKHKMYLDITSKCQCLTERCNYSLAKDDCKTDQRG